MTQRFTIDGDEKLEEHLSHLCDDVRKGILKLVPETKLEGIVLGGGYGRGEGGVLRTASGDQPYNDLEFFVFIKGSTVASELQYRRKLHDLGHLLSEEAGIELEFKILSLAKLRRSKPNMSYFDLVMGHRCVLGDSSLFDGCTHHRNAANIPLHEATRLLMNRCSGLLYAKERLGRAEFTAEDSDFVTRNIAKVQLALGDVLLTVDGLYHPSCIERSQRLGGQALPLDVPSILIHHATGVRFKLHPVLPEASAETLLQLHREVEQLARRVWLWLETRRLGKKYCTPQSYALCPGSKCPEHPGLRNFAVNLRHFGTHAALSPATILRYPRERLLRALPLLLWGMTSPQEQAMVAACLKCNTPNLGETVKAYTKIWQSFN